MLISFSIHLSVLFLGQYSLLLNTFPYENHCHLFPVYPSNNMMTMHIYIQILLKLFAFYVFCLSKNHFNLHKKLENLHVMSQSGCIKYYYYNTILNKNLKKKLFMVSYITCNEQPFEFTCEL